MQIGNYCLGEMNIGEVYGIIKICGYNTNSSLTYWKIKI